MLKKDVFVVQGARTPIGKFLGGLSQTSATDLGAAAAVGALERARVSPENIDGVFVGNVIQSSKDAAYIARHVGLKAGAPIETPALTVNRACASGLEAVIQGAKAIAFGEASHVLAGGAENMSMTPYAMRGVREGWRMVNAQVDDALFSALYDPMAGCSIGECVEALAQELGITREAADEAALIGQRRAADAVARGVFAEEIVPVTVRSKRRTVEVTVDETPRPETDAAQLAKLPPLFGGVITAGNSTGLNDAAAMVVMVGAEEAKTLDPLGRIVSWASVGVEPKRMGLGPIAASKKALALAGLSVHEMDVIEINDSFSVQYLAVEGALELDPEKTNRNGGAIALGHPMGATGTRLLHTALLELKRTRQRYALCTVCVGGGQGTSVIVERV